jgi:rod shape-determining protein MreB
MAAAVGAGLPVLESSGSMIVDIGGGTTEIAVICLGGMVAARSLKLGGDHLDDAIISHTRSTRGFAIGERTAESLKIALGYYGRPRGRPPVSVMGQDARQLRPGTLDVREEDVGAAMAEPLGQVVDIVRSILEQTPPELVRDLSENGIVLAGGGAGIAGLAETLQLITGVPVRIADRPMLCVALGAAEILHDRKLFAALFPTPQPLIGRWWRSLRFGMRESSSSS